MSDSVKCPFCGATIKNLLDIFVGDFGDDSEATVECYECEKEFTIIQHILVTYSTEPDPEFEFYLDNHPDIREKLDAHKSRMKAIISGDRNLSWIGE